MNPPAYTPRIHIPRRLTRGGPIVAAVSAFTLGPALASGPFPGPDGEALPFPDRAAVVRFLEEAPVLSWEKSDDGTNPRKRIVTLGGGGLEVKAVFRYMYDHKPRARGFLDSYESELAAHELALMLGLDNIPPTAARRINRKRGSLQLWVHGATSYAEIRETLGDDPDPPELARELDTMRLFDALIANQDRNPGNVLVGDDGRVWWIDHTRSFGGEERLRGLERIDGCDHSFHAALARLSEEKIEDRLRSLTPYVDALLARRRALLDWIRTQISERPGFIR